MRACVRACVRVCVCVLVSFCHDYMVYSVIATFSGHTLLMFYMVAHSMASNLDVHCLLMPCYNGHKVGIFIWI